MPMLTIGLSCYAAGVCTASMVAAALCRSTLGVATSAITAVLAGGTIYSRRISAALTMCKATVLTRKTSTGHFRTAFGITAVAIMVMLAGGTFNSGNIVTAFAVLVQASGDLNGARLIANMIAGDFCTAGYKSTVQMLRMMSAEAVITFSKSADREHAHQHDKHQQKAENSCS